MPYGTNGKSKRGTRAGIVVMALACSILLTIAGASLAQDSAPPSKGQIAQVPASPLIWQLPANVDKSYGTIDGHKLKGYVEEQAAISRKYRDAGNQWWGRIAGMASGADEQAGSSKSQGYWRADRDQADHDGAAGSAGVMGCDRGGERQNA